MQKDTNFFPPEFTSLSQALSSLYGKDIKLAHSFHVPGGDINKSYGMQLSNGKILFMKANEKANLELFKAEAFNLQTIKQTNTIKTPRLLALGTDNGEEVGYSFLLMDFLEFGDLQKNFWQNLAEKLSNLHKAKTDEFVIDGKFGFLYNNFIGKTKQENSAKNTWVDFFRENRLSPQFKMAEQYFSPEDFSLITKLLDNLDKFLVEPEKPSLLHGDLWGGNIICDTNTQPVLIDPACYVGHPEADIAMTELFGGFDPSFYAAYKTSGLLQNDYAERRDLYNLYHILNHLNMFGTKYLSAALSIIQKYTK